MDVYHFKEIREVSCLQAEIFSRAPLFIPESRVGQEQQETIPTPTKVNSVQHSSWSCKTHLHTPLYG